MNLLDINIQAYIPYIVDAYAKVYGMEHRAIIEKRINRIIYVMYNNVKGMNDYVNFLRTCKQKELAIKFLEQIGVDVSKEREKSYAEALSDDIEGLIENYIGGYYLVGSNMANLGINAWRNKDDKYMKILREGKINFLNFFRGEEAKKITQETFEDFCRTNEYNEIVEKITEYLHIYDKIIEEYKVYMEELEPYKKYIEEENKRRKNIETNIRDILYKNIERVLPDDIREFLDSKYNSSIDEKAEVILGDNLGERCYIEYFSQRYEEKLKDESISEYDKNLIYWYRIKYFQQMGITLDKDRGLVAEARDIYEDYIQQENVKKLILPTGVLDEITKQKKVAYEEMKKEFIYGEKSFIKNSKMLGDTPEDKKQIYNRQKKNDITVTGALDEDGFLSVLFYTVIWAGRLDYVLLHEICHAIESESVSKIAYRSGFDYIYDDKYDDKQEKNPYNSKYRKYERLNETVADILAIEAMGILHEQGIYIFESPLILDKDMNNNTSSIMKKLVAKFVKKYKKAVVSARLYGNMRELYNTVGKENFEEFNDVINKIDSLNGLMQKLMDNQNNDPVVLEYYEQLERLSKIYVNIGIYQSRKSIEMYQ